MFVLDCRSERRPSTRDDDDAQYISPAQMDWLKAGLLESRAVFKIIVNSVPISNFPALLDLAHNDRWEGYAAQRTEILTHIDEHEIQGVLWVAGDFHLASIGRVSMSGPGSHATEILVGPGAQVPNPLVLTLAAPQFEWASGVNNYATLRLDPSAREITVTYFSGSGSEIHRALLSAP